MVWSTSMIRARGLLQERVSAVVLFGPQGDVQADGLEVVHAGDLRTAVFVARELAVDGDAVLFSPACPSGNGFANYEERGAEFKRAVRDL
jgi:UDP-N-acetylmuramoylalanine--D-glutamate ligase